MTKKKMLGLILLGLLGLSLAVVLAAWGLTKVCPSWYVPARLSREELLAAETRMIATEAKFHNASQVAEGFILELTGEQINEMLAVMIDRSRILPEDIRDPAISLGDGVVFAGALVSWKGQQSVVSLKVKPYIDSAGLLHIEMGQLKAGALNLPDDWLSRNLDKLEESVRSRLTSSKSTSEEAQTAKKNQEMIARVFTALRGEPAPASFVTRENLQMAVQAIRISPQRVEIEFRPLPPPD